MSKKLFLSFVMLCLLLAGNFVFAAWFEPPGSTLQEQITYYFNVAMASAGVIALIVLAVSGAELIFYSGNPEKSSEAKKRAISAVVGLIITLSSFLIIQTINPRLKNLTPSENLRIAGKFWFWGGTDGPLIGRRSGCGINECLGSENGKPPFSCSNKYCGGFDYGDCPPNGGCPGSDPDIIEDCSVSNCISSYSGCGSDQCLGIDGTCDGSNCNGNIVKPAPAQMENIDEIKKKYGFLNWQGHIVDLSGKYVSNCDPNNPFTVYNAYLYRDYNFKNLFAVKRLQCGGEPAIIIDASSYILQKETPGVYFYGSENCYPSTDTPVSANTESMPEASSDEIKSIRVVNGPDPLKGSFFGLIYFNDSDYKTNKANPVFLHIGPRIWRGSDDPEIVWNNYSYCYNVGSIINGSWVIYKWVGFEGNDKKFAKAGDGVTLYGKTEWLGGYNEIKDVNSAPPRRWFDPYLSMTTKNLKQTPVFYGQNSEVPEEEQKLCRYFNPDSFCLKSFEIKGNYLALVSSDQDLSSSNYSDLAGLISTQQAHAQVFPISPRLKETSKEEIFRKRKEDYSIEKGTLELSLDYIGWLKQAKFIEVIPLAEKLK